MEEDLSVCVPTSPLRGYDGPPPKDCEGREAGAKYAGFAVMVKANLN
jgi:hypothetical protein